MLEDARVVDTEQAFGVAAAIAVRAPARGSATRFDANDWTPRSSLPGHGRLMLCCAPGRANEGASLNKVMRIGRRKTGHARRSRPAGWRQP